jgi:inosine-uridine nucleoside N-ribohydrolase
VLYAADDSIFKAFPAGIRVETKGSITQGKTVTDLFSDAKWQQNAFAVMEIDRDALCNQGARVDEQVLVLFQNIESNFQQALSRTCCEHR